MTTETHTPLSAIICAGNKSLKAVLREGAKQAGIVDAMILDKTSDAVRELKIKPTSWLLIDYSIPVEDLSKILTAAQGINSFATRPIYLVASESNTKIVIFALEFNVTKVHLGEIKAPMIVGELQELGRAIADRAPICDALLKVHHLVGQKKFDEVETLFTGLLEANKTNTRLVCEYIDFLIHANNPGKAQQYIDDVRKKEPNDLKLYHLQARCHMKAKRFNDAIKVLEQAEASNPWNPNRLIELGNALLATSRYTEARDRFNRALQLDPGSADAASGKSQATLLSGDLEGGLASLQELGHPRQMASTLNAAAVFAARSNRLDEARNLYARGIQLLHQDGPSCSRLWYNLGILEHRSDNLSRAMMCFQTSSVTDPAFQDAKYNLGIIRQLIDGLAKPSSKKSTSKVSATSGPSKAKAKGKAAAPSGKAAKNKESDKPTKKTPDKTLQVKDSLASFTDDVGAKKLAR